MLSGKLSYQARSIRAPNDKGEGERGRCARETNLISLKMSYGSRIVTCNVVIDVIKDELNEKYIISNACEREIVFIVILTLLLVYITMR